MQSRCFPLVVFLASLLSTSSLGATAHAQVDTPKSAVRDEAHQELEKVLNADSDVPPEGEKPICACSESRRHRLDFPDDDSVDVATVTVTEGCEKVKDPMCFTSHCKGNYLLSDGVTKEPFEVPCSANTDEAGLTELELPCGKSKTIRPYRVTAMMAVKIDVAPEKQTTKEDIDVACKKCSSLSDPDTFKKNLFAYGYWLALLDVTAPEPLVRCIDKTKECGLWGCKERISVTGKQGLISTPVCKYDPESKFLKEVLCVASASATEVLFTCGNCPEDTLSKEPSLL